MIPMTFDAVVFDADETIFNNQGIHIIVTGRVLENLGLSKDLIEQVRSKWDHYYFKEQTRVVEEVGFCIDRENAARSLVLALKEFGKEISLEEADKYILWGYDGEPSKMTVNGMTLFSNLALKYAGLLTDDSIPGYDIYLLFGIISLVSIVLIRKIKK